MDASELRHDMLAKWELRRATISRVIQATNVTIEDITKHFQTLADILGQATQHKVVFDRYEETFNARENLVGAKFKLSCPAIGATWERPILFGVNSVIWERKAFSNDYLDQVKTYINLSVQPEFNPPPFEEL